MMITRLPDMVKGVGYSKIGGIRPIEDDDDRVFSMSQKAEAALRASVKRGIESPQSVVKGFKGEFGEKLASFLQFQPGNNGLAALTQQISGVLSAELGKNISLTSPLASGFVPFDLVAPSRLIYPVYSPMRNKIPRTPGQGNSRRAKLVNGISGSRTAGSVGNSIRWSINEFDGGSFSSWPNGLPAAGAQNAVDLNIPYKFFGLSESLSWLAQFGGQGFEDISSLANLILLQEAMIAEEDAIFSGTGTALSTPSAPTVVARAAGTGEVPVTGGTTTIYVVVTATNYYGETLPSTAGTAAVASGDVYDVTIVPVRGAFQYNVYVTTGASAGTYYLYKKGQGGTLLTLQGALPVSGANPPTHDTGTSSANDFEGLMSILDGHAVTDASVYPAGWSGVGTNKAVGATLGIAPMFTVLQQLWDTGSSADGVAGAYRANPAELVCEGTDASRLATDLLNNNSDATAYRMFISQDDVGGIRSGAAVSEFQNPITRAVVKVLVHPWLTQGTAFVMSYTLPMSWTNVANCWEMVMVQDLLSVSWPVIDPTFRYSIFEYGSFVGYGPQYSAVLGGLQVSGTKPYS